MARFDNFLEIQSWTAEWMAKARKGNTSAQHLIITEAVDQRSNLEAIKAKSHSGWCNVADLEISVAHVEAEALEIIGSHNNPLLSSIQQLSGRTLATLTGITSYDALDTIRTRFLIFAAKTSSAANLTWQQTWPTFWLRCASHFDISLTEEQIQTLRGNNHAHLL